MIERHTLNTKLRTSTIDQRDMSHILSTLTGISAVSGQTSLHPQGQSLLAGCLPTQVMGPGVAIQLQRGQE